MIESELNQRFKFIVQGTAEQKAALEVRPDLSYLSLRLVVTA